MISTLLVANRGEIARRVIRSARALGIATVAVFSDADADAPHRVEADRAVHLPGTAPADTYLAIDTLVEAARACGADAVHPGYGFLSENADFARACEEAGLVFIGPPPDVIEAMGSKLAAKALLAEAGVPVLPTVEVPAAAVAPASGDALGPVVDAAAGLGWPVLVKASAGGGGRGMRVVESAEDLPAALAAAARQALAAFGDGTVFLEPYVERPRHVEVQIVGDRHGTVAHLFERDCSVQRRHQKIIEECPSPALTASQRAALAEAAVTAGRAIGYVGAGTVEFLLLPDGSFAFLEVNTRLQVEHPVTEAVTGIDLVALQLRVAEGEPLGADVLAARLDGHAVEARVYAEDPTRGWQPSAGRISRIEWPSSVAGGPPPVPRTGATVRVDSGVEDGSTVSPHYDPMLAKVVAHAPTRGEAIRLLAATLRAARLHGVTTNRDLLVRILDHPEFAAGGADTWFLDRHDPAELGAPLAGADTVRLHAVAAALAEQHRRRDTAPVWGRLPSGWRNNPSQPQSATFVGPHGPVEVTYRFDRRGALVHLGADGEVWDVAGRPRVRVSAVGAGSVDLERDGVLGTYRVEASPEEASAEGDGRTFYVDGPDGSSKLVEVERFPLPGSLREDGSLSAPLPGTVVTVAVAPGDVVAAGDVLVAIEAMKMEHEIRVAAGGVVAEVHVGPGDQVEAGRVLVTLAGASEADGSACGHDPRRDDPRGRQDNRQDRESG